MEIINIELPLSITKAVFSSISTDRAKKNRFCFGTPGVYRDALFSLVP